MKAPDIKPPVETAAPPRAPSGKAPAAKGAAFRTVLAERAGAAEPPPAPPPSTVAPGPAAPSRAQRRSDEPPSEREREPEPRAPARAFVDGLREPGPACFGSSPAPTPVAAGPGAVTDPTALAAVAERVLRSLRVGTDAQGRSLVQLELAEGPLAGCRVELRRVAGGVAVDVRDASGAADARESLVADALRRRGIEVV